VNAITVVQKQRDDEYILGPIQYYLAKVDNAASTSTTGLQWFKVAQDGLSNGKWAVDTMIANRGWHYFDMPTCVAPGDYLLRVELIALHSASTQGSSPRSSFCNAADFGQAVLSSTWNAHRSASRVAARTKAPTSSLSPVLIKLTTPVSKSASMIPRGNRIWVARPTPSQGLRP
jgi:hypothetical protein